MLQSNKLASTPWQERIITAAQMRAAEQSAMQRGHSGWRLMHQAGLLATEQIIAFSNETLPNLERRSEPPHAMVLCGPGNNGADGYVIASRLRRSGWSVHVIAIGASTSRAKASSETAIARDLWLNESEPSETTTLEAFLSQAEPIATSKETNSTTAQSSISLLKKTGDISQRAGKYDVIVDAVFGTGLARDLNPETCALVNVINKSHDAGVIVVAIDLPSGGDADTGKIKPVGIKANLTITFGWLKHGHALMPLSELCGKVIRVDIGLNQHDLPDSLSTPISGEISSANVFDNSPNLWQHTLPKNEPAHHKYHHGYALIASGETETMPGATRLARDAALRSGCGLVAIAATPNTAGLFAADAINEILHIYRDKPDCHTNTDDTAAPQDMSYPSWQELLTYKKIDAVLLGPGGGQTTELKSRTATALHSNVRLVLDAASLSCWHNAHDEFYSLLIEHGRSAGITRCPVLTPHSGEFAKIFPRIYPNKNSAVSKVDITLSAAHLTGSVVLFKGSDTVIACPQGRAVIQREAPPGLAVAGSGDVLAGLLSGLLARGVPSFEAACAAQWLHVQAAKLLPTRFCASDITSQLCTTSPIAHQCNW